MRAGYPAAPDYTRGRISGLSNYNSSLHETIANTRAKWLSRNATVGIPTATRKHNCVDTSKPPDIAGTIDAANRCAESPVKTDGGPGSRRIRIDDRRYPAAVESEFYVRLLAAERWIAEPGSLEVCLFDARTEFRNESLHRDHLIPIKLYQTGNPGLLYFGQSKADHDEPIIYVHRSRRKPSPIYRVRSGPP